MSNFYKNLRAWGIAAAMSTAASLYAQTGTLTIEVKDITSTDATVVITPSSDDLNYYWGLSTKADFEAKGGADKAVDNRIKIWENTAKYYDDGTTWQEAMSWDLKSGVVNEPITERFDPLTPDTDYVVYAFGMDAQGELTAPLNIKEFTNKVPAYTLSVELKDKQAVDATIVITPSSDEMTYYWGMSSKNKFESEGGADKAVENRIQIWKNTASSWDDGTTWQEVMSWDLKSGVVDEKLSERFELFPDNDYVIYAFGIDAQGELTAPVTTLDYSTIAAIPSDNTFTLSIVSVQPDNTQRMNVKAKITPTNDDKYTVRLVEKKYLEKYDLTSGSGSEKDFINDYMLYYLNDSNIYSGEQTVTFTGQTPDSDYCLFVIGIDENKAPSTALSKLDFRTERYPLRSITIEVSDVSPMNAHIKVTPSDPEMRYYIDIAPVSIIEDKGGEDCIAEKLIIDWWKYIADLYDNQYTWQDFIEPQTRTGALEADIADLVKDGLLSTQYWNDDWALYAVGFSTDGEVLTEPAVAYYTSPAPDSSDMTFEFELVSAVKDETSQSRMEPYTARVNIFPSRTGEEFKVNYTRKSTFDAWVYNELYGMEEFIKTQWLDNAVSFTDAVCLEMPGLDRYLFEGGKQTYTLTVMGWNEGPTTEPAVLDISYDDFTGITVNKADGVTVTGGDSRISVIGSCENVVVYSAAGQVMGTLRTAGTIQVPAGIYVVHYTQNGNHFTTKVAVR